MGTTDFILPFLILTEVICDSSICGVITVYSANPKLSRFAAVSNLSSLVSAPRTTAIRFISSLFAVAQTQNPAFDVVPVFRPVIPSYLLTSLLVLLSSVSPFLR